MGPTFKICEKCNKPIYPASYRNEERSWIPIWIKRIGKTLRRVYWCKNCNKFYD